MTDTPWTGDACSLVDAFRAGERSPTEELAASLDAIDASTLNCFSFLDPERAIDAAKQADVSRPFGGVPTGIKELDRVKGWPNTEASLVFADRIADYTQVSVERLLDAGGAVPVGLTTASEFGGLNVSVTRLNGVTHNPWEHGRTAGGSSGGSSAAVAGGLVALATGGDGGGSIRIPAAYCGLLGMKGTFGRIPRSPHAFMRPNTVVYGNPARSVRDAARLYDVCAGPHGADPTSLPEHAGFEAALGTHELAGRKVAIVPNLGGVPLDPGVEDHLRAAAAELIAEAGLVQVDLDLRVPNFMAHWMMGNTATLAADLGDLWPGCAGDLTNEVAGGLFVSQSMYNLQTAARAELLRIELNEAMAAAFDEVDFIIAATNPGPAFAADSPTSNPEGSQFESALNTPAGRVALRGVLGATRAAATMATRLPTRILDKTVEREPDLVAMGMLTAVSNVYGNPAVSIPIGTVADARGSALPVGMQVLAAHHRDSLLFDVALSVERERPWPLVAAQASTASEPSSA